MPNSKLTNFILLPKLSLLDLKQKPKNITFFCETSTKSIWCTNCGLECFKVHDRRLVKIKDAPTASKQKYLVIKKKRFRCCGCKKVITETIPGIQKSARLTERLQRNLQYVCHKFANMNDVRKHL